MHCALPILDLLPLLPPLPTSLVPPSSSTLSTLPSLLTPYLFPFITPFFFFPVNITSRTTKTTSPFNLLPMTHPRSSSPLKTFPLTTPSEPWLCVQPQSRTCFSSKTLAMLDLSSMCWTPLTTFSPKFCLYVDLFPHPNDIFPSSFVCPIFVEIMDDFAIWKNTLWFLERWM